MSDFEAESPLASPSAEYLTVLVLYEKKDRATNPAKGDKIPQGTKIFALPFRFETAPEKGSSERLAHRVLPPIEISTGLRGVRKLRAILKFVSPNVVHAYSERSLDAFIRARPRFLRCREIWSQQADLGVSTGARATVRFRRQWHFLFYRFGLILQDSSETMPPPKGWATTFLHEQLNHPSTLEDALELRSDLLAAYNQRSIAVFTRYHRDGASSRVRHLQFDRQEQLDNYRFYFFPLLAASYLQNRYSGKLDYLSIIRSYIRRVYLLRLSRFAEILWIEKESLPWAPHQLESLLTPKLPTVLDFDDAVFEQYRHLKNNVAAFLLRDKSFLLAKTASVVTVGNQYLQKVFHANAQVSAEIIPSVVELPPIDSSGSPPQSGKFVLAWIGTPVTFRQYLEPMMEFLTNFVEEEDGEIWLIGGPETMREIPPVRSFQWYEGVENDIFPGVSAGIMPLTDDPWSRGKCGYKLLQYMAHGIPVIASPVGVNTDIVKHGENGFLASSLEDWRQCLAELRDNPCLRNTMGAAGRKLTQETYAIPQASSQLRSIFDSIWIWPKSK